MAYFADLSRYSYHHAQPSDRLLNVGWLENGYAFPVAPPSDELLSALFSACERKVNPMRGFQSCSFCSSRKHQFTEAHWKGKVPTLGSAEIRVANRAGITFAAPNLIFHYVQEHHYLPPRVFIEALLHLRNSYPDD